MQDKVFGVRQAHGATMERTRLRSQRFLVGCLMRIRSFVERQHGFESGTKHNRVEGMRQRLEAFHQGFCTLAVTVEKRHRVLHEAHAHGHRGAKFETFRELNLSLIHI